MKKTIFFGIKRTARLYKAANYEISKTRKYKKDIGRIENMEYDAAETAISAGMEKNLDCYKCPPCKTAKLDM